MNITEYQFDSTFIASRVAEHRAALQARDPNISLEEKAVSVIYDRLLADPARYLEFGPWWWAVKLALANAGKEIGSDSDPYILSAYRINDESGNLDVAASLTAAEEFRELYQSTFFRGTRTFDLGGDITAYQLIDDDIELVIGGTPGA